MTNPRDPIPSDPGQHDYAEPVTAPVILDSASAYIRPADMAYPYTYGRLRSDFPQVSFPAHPTAEMLAQYGIFPVQTVPAPEYYRLTQVRAELPPAEIDGVWTQQWVVRDKTMEELVAVRDSLHDQRRTARTNAEMAGFVFQGKRIDSDRDSILRITQAALLASQALAAEQPFGVEWVCADDSVLELDAAGMLAMQQVLTLHGLACHNRSQVLRELIDAAADGPALSAVANAITTGWPE